MSTQSLAPGPWAGWALGGTLEELNKGKRTRSVLLTGAHVCEDGVLCRMKLSDCQRGVPTRKPSPNARRPSLNAPWRQWMGCSCTRDPHRVIHAGCAAAGMASRRPVLAPLWALLRVEKHPVRPDGARHPNKAGAHLACSAREVGLWPPVTCMKRNHCLGWCSCSDFLRLSWGLHFCGTQTVGVAIRRQ